MYGFQNVTPHFANDDAAKSIDKILEVITGAVAEGLTERQGDKDKNKAATDKKAAAPKAEAAPKVEAAPKADAAPKATEEAK